MDVISVGIALVLLGLTALLTMVVHVLTPDVVLALMAFVATFGGTLVVLMSVVRRIERRSNRA